MIEARADRELGKLPPDVQERLDAAIDTLAEDPYRLRVGDYRALYLVNDAQREVTVTRGGHRRSVYR